MTTPTIDQEQCDQVLAAFTEEYEHTVRLPITEYDSALLDSFIKWLHDRTKAKWLSKDLPAYLSVLPEEERIRVINTI